MASNRVKDTAMVENVSGEIVDLNIPEPDEILDGEVKKDESDSKSLTKEEKHNSRAERLGTVAAVKDSEETKKAKDLKQKARADRFGVPSVGSCAIASSPTRENLRLSLQMRSSSPPLKPLHPQKQILLIRET
ncbi:unnamed protein product [Brassica rapa subsp. trilocularis]